MAFVHHKGNVLNLNLCGKLLVLLGRRIFCAATNDGLQFLNSRDDRIPIFACQFLFQVGRFIGVLNVNVITVGVGLKGVGCLLIQVLTVDQEDGFVDAGNVEQVLRDSVRGQRLAGAGRVPDKARLSIARGLADRLDGMNLVGA